LRVVFVEHASAVIPEAKSLMRGWIRDQCTRDELSERFGIAGIDFSQLLDDVMFLGRQLDHLAAAIEHVGQGDRREAAAIARRHLLQVLADKRREIVVATKQLDDDVCHVRVMNLEGLGFCHRQLSRTDRRSARARAADQRKCTASLRAFTANGLTDSAAICGDRLHRSVVLHHKIRR
jgi:hypothetical protein